MFYKSIFYQHENLTICRALYELIMLVSLESRIFVASGRAKGYNDQTIGRIYFPMPWMCIGRSFLRVQGRRARLIREVTWLKGKTLRFRWSSSAEYKINPDSRLDEQCAKLKTISHWILYGSSKTIIFQLSLFSRVSWGFDILDRKTLEHKSPGGFS